MNHHGQLGCVLATPFLLLVAQPPPWKILLDFKSSVLSCTITILLLTHCVGPQHSSWKILLDFKSSVLSCNPDALPTWDMNRPITEWEGISLLDNSSDGGAVTSITVTALDLASSSLCGPLPAALSQLSGLTALDLSVNTLSGPLPPKWSTLQGLVVLNLHNNSLHGTLQPEWSTLRNLGMLNLCNNSLHGTLPASWSELVHLVELNMRFNRFDGGLPLAWGALRGLTGLYLSVNFLSGTLPLEWSALQSLQDLRMPHNAFIGLLPSEWSQLSRLSLLSLANNSLDGPLPSAWSTLQSLTALWLGDNSLSGRLTGAWSVLHKLAELSVESNSLRGPLPSEWSTLSGLSVMDLANNSLRGPLPQVWSVLQNLTFLWLNGNFLDGSLPVGWSQLSRLTILNLANNSLDGPLPAAWSGLHKLEALFVASNSLIGPLPPAWSALQNLRRLLLGNNSLDGTLPSAWVTMSKLLVTNASTNMLVMNDSTNHSTRSLADRWIGNNRRGWWDELVAFDVSKNRLTGTLPQLPEQIKYFSASGNSFTGTLPPPPVSMLYYKASQNRLTGAVPDVYSNSSLVYLNLDDNALSTLPAVFQGPNIFFLSIARNQLQGTLPADYNHSLSICDLSSNQLSGPIPTSWADRNWVYVALDGNKLSGLLPSAWRGSVAVLQLQNNQLEGSVPPSWPHNRTARILSFSGNRISILPEEWALEGSFSNLSLLAVAGTSVKIVPLAWVSKTAFNQQQGAGTVLQLGGLWVSSSQRSKDWRQKVCMDAALDGRLKRYLKQFTMSLELQAEIQSQTIAGLLDAMQHAELKEVVTLSYADFKELPLRLAPPVRVTRKQVCDNALWILIVQWGLVGGLVLLMIVLYYCQARWNLLLRGVSRLCNWFGPVRPFALSERGPASESISVSLPTSQQKSVSFRQSLSFAVGLAFYWFDLIADIYVIIQVWKFWPGKVLLGISALNYAVTLFVLVWRLNAAHWGARLLVVVFGFPLMPVLDTLMFISLVLGRSTTQLPNMAMQWHGLFEMRDALELTIEAIPTSILQSVVFALGNQPGVGWYLDQRLYILSAAGSCAQIVRMVGMVLWQAACVGQRPWTVFLSKVSLSRMGDGAATSAAPAAAQEYQIGKAKHTSQTPQP